MPLTLQQMVPLSFGKFDCSAQKTGLVIVDEVRGFAEPGCGPMAPPEKDPVIDRMIRETDHLAQQFAAQKAPILVFQDSHIPGKPEPPYPPHCEQGSGQEELVSELRWLLDCPQALLMPKDCINGFIGGFDLGTGHNQVLDWINSHKLEAVLVVGICTDICVMDFVLTLLSVRNHGMTPHLQEIVAYEPGLATYDLPLEVARALGLPDNAAHPRAETHHMGLYFMASRGAQIVKEYSFT